MLPGWAPTRTLRALSQPWEGDVTMVLPDSLAQMRGALLTPSRAELAAAARMVSRLLPKCGRGLACFLLGIWFLGRRETLLRGARLAKDSGGERGVEGRVPPLLGG